MFFNEEVLFYLFRIANCITNIISELYDEICT